MTIGADQSQKPRLSGRMQRGKILVKDFVKAREGLHRIQMRIVHVCMRLGCAAFQLKQQSSPLNSQVDS